MPLSVTMGEKISALRGWASSRTVRANSALPPLIQNSQWARPSSPGAMHPGVVVSWRVHDGRDRVTFKIPLRVRFE